MNKLKYKPIAVKAIKAIQKEYIKHIISQIIRLQQDPLPRGVKKLKAKNLFRIRQGNFRIGYEIDKELKFWKTQSQDDFVKYAKKLLNKGFTEKETKNFLIQIYRSVGNEYGD